MSLVQKLVFRLTKSVVIAVDGTAASGKGTLARRLASEFQYAYLDTGLLYRCIALSLLDSGHDPTDGSRAESVAERFTLRGMNFSNPALRNEEIGNAAGIVAANANVRAALINKQRRFAADPPNAAAGAVLDGRDIGTVICPDADYKFFVDASACACLCFNSFWNSCNFRSNKDGANCNEVYVMVRGYYDGWNNFSIVFITNLF